MKLFTQGQLHVTGVSIKTTIELTEIGAKLSDRPYSSSAIPNEGWGGVPYSWEDSNDEEATPPLPTRTFGHGRPSVANLQDGTQVALARLLFDSRDRAITRRVGLENVAGVRADVQYQFDAIDVMMLRHGDNQLVVYIASRDARQVERVINRLVSDLGLQRAEAEVDNPMRSTAPPGDLFLWLMHRWDMNNDLTQKLKLTQYRSVTASDGIEAETRVLKYVSLTRDEVLALVSNPNSVFGPAKFSLFTKDRGLHVDLFLFLDGRFEVIVGDSFTSADPSIADRMIEYRKRRAALTRPISPQEEEREEMQLRMGRDWLWGGMRATFGIELVYVVGEKLLSSLYQVYNRDPQWISKDRPAFRERAGSTLIDRVERRLWPQGRTRKG